MSSGTPAASRPGDGDPPEAPSDAAPSPSIVAGRYRLLGRIAEGGMGVVFRAEHTLSKKKLAVKLLHPHLCHGRQAVERFKREVSAAAEIDHPGIVQIFDAGVDTDGSFYMAMELLQGESLGERARRDWPGTRTAVAMIAEMCEPLAKAHAKGFVHRDLKPDNVFLARDPETGRERLKLLDFGLVREVTRRGPTMSGVTFGTPEYMSPEQAMSAKKAGVPADVWSVGVMLYELLAGRHPFTGETPNAVMANSIKEPLPPLAETAPHVPADLAAIVERCLEKDPAKRPADAGELGELLRDLLQTVPLDDRRPENPEIRRGHDDEDGDGSAELDAIQSVQAGPRPRIPEDSPTVVRPSAAAPRRTWAWAALGASTLVLVAAIAIVASSGGEPAMTATPLSTEVPGPSPPPVALSTQTSAPAPAHVVAAPAAPVAPATAAPEAVSEAAPAATPRAGERPRPRARSGAPAEAPPEPAPEPEPPAEGQESAVAAAHACLARGDTRCAVAALQDARGAPAMALLVDVYRAQGRASDARGVMQRYVDRYPRAAQAAEYRRQLGLSGP